MSIMPTAHTAVPGLTAPAPPVRRVRHQAREGVALMAFSAATSFGFAASCCSSSAWDGRRPSMSTPRHVPVLLDRVVALLAPALDHDGAVLVDATLGLGGHTEAVLTRCTLARVVGIDRDPDALALAGERLAPFGDRFTGVHAVYDELPEVLADLGLAVGRRGALRPRRLLDAARRAASGASPTRRRAPRHADGRHHRPDRRRRPQHLPGRGPGPGPQGVRRGEVRPPDRRARWSRARERGAVHHLGPAGRAAVRRRSRRRPAGPAATPPSAPSRRCGWRSTTSSPCCAGRSPPPSTRSASAAGWSWSPTTRSRTGWSSRRSPRPPARDVPVDLPVRARGPRAGPAAGHPRRRAGRRRRDRAQPARRLGPAARRRTRPTPHPAQRSRIAHEQPRPLPAPRVARPADRRGRP